MPVLVVKVVVLGAFVAFVLWCMYEAVVEYRFERKMQELVRSHALRMGRFNWLDPNRKNRKILPLFNEQGEDDV